MSHAEQLQTLLERQISLIRAGDIGSADALTGQAQAFLEDLRLHPELPPADAKRISDLYQELTLILATQRDATSAELRRLSAGKRATAAYRR